MRRRPSLQVLLYNCKIISKGTAIHKVVEGKEAHLSVILNDKRGNTYHGTSDDLKVVVKDSNGSVLETKMTFDDKKHEYHVSFVPVGANITVEIFTEKGGVPHSCGTYHPKVVLSPSAAHSVASGPGIGTGLKESQPTHFFVDGKDRLGEVVAIAPQDVVVSIKDSEGNEVPHTSLHEKDRIKVEYTPENQGTHTISLSLNGVEIQGTPIKVNIEPVVNVANSKVSGRIKSLEAYRVGPCLEGEVFPTTPTHVVAHFFDKRGTPIDVTQRINPYSIS